VCVASAKLKSTTQRSSNRNRKSASNTQLSKHNMDRYITNYMVSGKKAVGFQYILGVCTDIFMIFRKQVPQTTRMSKLGI